MKDQDGKWCISTNGIDYDGDFFDTKEEAIEAFKKDLSKGYYSKTTEMGHFWVGQCFSYSLNQFFNAEDIIENAWERAQDEGGEYAEDWLQDLSDDQKQELDKLVLGWAEKHGIYPNFYQIKNEEKISL